MKIDKLGPEIYTIINDIRKIGLKTYSGIPKHSIPVRKLIYLKLKLPDLELFLFLENNFLTKIEQ